MASNSPMLRAPDGSVGFTMPAGTGTKGPVDVNNWVQWNEQILYPLLLSFLAGISTTLGALIVLFLGKSPSPQAMSFSLSLAAGVMLCVSVLEFWIPALWEGKNILKFILSTAAGCGCFLLIEKCLPDQSEAAELLPEIDEEQQTVIGNDGGTLPQAVSRSKTKAEDQAKKMRLALLMMLVLTLHNFPEGLAVAVSTVESAKTGLIICVAIAIHNIPEGIAIAVPYFDAEGDRWKAIRMALLSGLSEPLGALVALLVLKPILNHGVIEAILIFVGGIMVCVALFELMPASASYGAPVAHWCGVGCGGLIMLFAHWVADGGV